MLLDLTSPPAGDEGLPLEVGEAGVGTGDARVGAAGIGAPLVAEKRWMLACVFQLRRATSSDGHQRGWVPAGANCSQTGKSIHRSLIPALKRRHCRASVASGRLSQRNEIRGRGQKWLTHGEVEVDVDGGLRNERLLLRRASISMREQRLGASWAKNWSEASGQRSSGDSLGASVADGGWRATYQSV